MKKQNLLPLFAALVVFSAVPVGTSARADEKQGEDKLLGIQRMKSAIIDYRLRHNGAFPQKTREVLDDISLLVKEGKIADYWDYVEPLYTGDRKSGKAVFFDYKVKNVRLDDKSIGSPLPRGAKESLAYTDRYTSDLLDRTSNGSNPQGDYIVLWSDMTISTVPYDCIVVARSVRTKTSYTRRLGFEGDAGLLLNGLTFAEDSGYLPPKNPPMGKPGAKLGRNTLDAGTNGPESLVALSRRMNYPTIYGIARDKLWQTFDPAQPDITLAQLQSGAAKLGFAAQKQRVSLQVLEQKNVAAALYRPDDGRIVVLTALDESHAVIVDRGTTHILTREALEQSVGSEVEALYTQAAVNRVASIRADDAVREIKLTSLESEVPQQFVLRNTGAAPITLQLEYPLLGISEAKLSQDVVAPGETATLDIKVSWRSVLKAPSQNVLVSIQTSDPIAARLQLAILLTPPEN